MNEHAPTLKEIQETYDEFVRYSMLNSWDYNAEVAHELARDAALDIPVLMRLVRLIGPVVSGDSIYPDYGFFENRCFFCRGHIDLNEAEQNFPHDDDCPFEVLRGAWEQMTGAREVSDD